MPFRGKPLHLLLGAWKYEQDPCRFFLKGGLTDASIFKTLLKYSFDTSCICAYGSYRRVEFLIVFFLVIILIEIREDVSILFPILSRCLTDTALFILIIPNQFIEFKKQII